MTRITRVGAALFGTACLMKAALVAHYGVESTPEQHDLSVVTTITGLVALVMLLWDE